MPNQESYIFNGYNDVYPLIQAKYSMFEPEKETFTVNMKEVVNNHVGFKNELNLALYTKENKEKCGLIILLAEPRNNINRIFAWFVK
jgi:hypothetical protein